MIQNGIQTKFLIAGLRLASSGARDNVTGARRRASLLKVSSSLHLRCLQPYAYCRQLRAQKLNVKSM